MNRFVGKYELIELLGGNVAEVYRARDSVLGRVVALKLLTEAGLSDPESMARFLAEARLLSDLTHENIIRFYDFGDDAGRPYIVMEFLRGVTLRKLIADRRPAELRDKLGLALQLAHGLGYIHSKRIIHRDVKPENVYVDETNTIKLMDFGIAKQEGIALTGAGFTLGTPYYMAPEQVQGRAITHLIDIYAFGILLIELVTGLRPVDGGGVDRIFDAIVHEPLDLGPLRAVEPPDALIGVIEDCTRKEPADRIQSFAEVGSRLEKLLEV